MPGTVRLAGGIDAERQLVLHRRIRWFVAVTISYNVIEAIVAITAGTIASSAALVGFGLDSVIEVASAAAVAWQFAAKDPETREKTALRIIAYSFFALAAYVSVDALMSLFGSGGEARHSTPGLTLAGLSLLIMPFLSYGQRRTGRELGSRSAVADSKQTLLCTYLSAVLLVGLALNSLFGWSWADPIAALVIAVVAVKEGREAWNGDTCCAPTAALRASDDTNDSSDSCCPTTVSTANLGTQQVSEEDDCDCCSPTTQSSEGTAAANIDLLIVPECRNESEAAHLLRTAMDEIGLRQTEFRTVTIDDSAKAGRHRFTGSPTFMVDGVDLFEDPARPIGLSCRLYRHAARVAGVPDRGELTQALKRATHQPQ